MRVTSCPICGITWAAQIACCPCGFAPSAMDEFLVRLALQRRRGLARVGLGIALCAAVFPLIWLVSVSAGWALATPLIGGFAVGGAIQIMRGLHVTHQSTQRLRAAREIRQLPAARVIVK